MMFGNYVNYKSEGVEQITHASGETLIATCFDG